ncbi:hypothetical protein EDD11_008773 [Mortierella claussenii]|nr:hypothetical protein EDD11_008773 [Mortierella claussenii]
MGVFGEKHTSLTREQKRQLIHQADTHKLRPTEVCDWVLATWGLRIARVTVYSILHKQRASLMAGHKDLYQSMQNSINGLQTSGSSSSSSASASFTNTYSAGDDACLGLNKDTGRVNKYRASSKRAHSSGNINPSSSVVSDLPFSATFSSSGEGARWEGQLKRVREPASIELDRAMVQFLKSSAAVDAHGRRLNDAELQSHALRLARNIPGASRMRCSFGWLRHFKRRLGVQWAADRLGQYRWIVEMDPFEPNDATAPDTAAAQPSSQAESSPSAARTVISSAEISASSSFMMVDAHNNNSRHLSYDNPSSWRQDKVKQEHGNNRILQSQTHHQHYRSQQAPDRPAEDADEDEHHSSHRLLGEDFDPTSATANAFVPSMAKTHFRSASTSGSASTSTSASGIPNATPSVFLP